MTIINNGVAALRIELNRIDPVSPQVINRNGTTVLKTPMKTNYDRGGSRKNGAEIHHDQQAQQTKRHLNTTSTNAMFSTPILIHRNDEP
jgi:hypothetical protein